jgi:PUA-domain protein
MSRHILSKKDYKNFMERLKKYNIDGSSMADIEIEENKKNEIYYFSGKPVFYNGIPTLYLINYLKPETHNITVDDGAVPHIMNGSNLFAPGIKEISNDVKQGDMVFIKNINGLYIAIGTANKNFNIIMSEKKGEAVKILHYLNDNIMKGE